jgi:hypothetical protein
MAGSDVWKWREAEEEMMRRPVCSPPRGAAAELLHL